MNAAGAEPLLSMLPLAALLGLLLSACITRLAVAYGASRLLDLPGHRRSHAHPTPRGGGIGPVLAILIVGVGLTWPYAPRSMAVWASCFGVLALLGWIDDHRPLPVLPRLAVQALACVIAALWALEWASQGTTPEPWLAPAAAFVALMVLLNATNFMDGINGLAASQLAFAALAVAAFAAAKGAPVVSLLGVVMGSALVGFLPFNVPTARIFMGDVGSTALGFWLAALLVSATSSGALGIGTALVLSSGLLVDASLTLGWRVLRGRRWWRPHREHLYQWLVRSGFSHAQVAVGYLGWSLFVALPLALLMEFRAGSAPADHAPAMLGYTALLPGFALLLAATVWLAGKRWCRARKLGRW